MKVIPETLNLISTCYYYHFTNTSFGGLLFPEGIILPVGSALAALSCIGDLSRYWFFCLGPLVLMLPKL